MSEVVTMVPTVGDGATMLGWSDRHPYTVIEVSPNGRTVVVQEDFAVRTDNYGMSDCQSYEYSRNPDGRTSTVTLRKNGRWVVKGQGLKNGTGFAMGSRRKYYDYSF
jgi:hypothetical protein